MNEQLVKVHNVFKIYQSGNQENRLETVALKGISLDIYKEDFIAVMGPSGSGKSTLLNLLGGLDQPSAGNIVYRIDRHTNRVANLAKMTEAQLDEFRHNRIGVVFQVDNLIYHLTALENVELPLKFLGVQDSQSRAIKILSKIGLKERLHHRPSQLSAGERQRVALGTAIAFKPLIILADEPTGELDSSNVEEVMNLFKMVHKEEEIVFFLVTHNPEVARHANRYFTLFDGSLTEQSDLPTSLGIPVDLGEYAIAMDKYHRIRIPQDLIDELPQLEGLLQLTHNENEIQISLPGDDISGELVQMDLQNRILLPEEVFKSVSSPHLRGIYDEEKKRILIKFENNSKEESVVGSKEKVKSPSKKKSSRAKVSKTKTSKKKASKKRTSKKRTSKMESMKK
ncbi:MAG: ABC transporter ATP-binding protein [Candidatus Kariarchaeaceae archaeon]|jgi:putative ABC transport system ATP-binding protein